MVEVTEYGSDPRLGNATQCVESIAINEAIYQPGFD